MSLASDTTNLIRSYYTREAARLKIKGQSFYSANKIDRFQNEDDYLALIREANDVIFMFGDTSIESS